MNELTPCILLHYNEIALKKGNRSYFVKKLIENIRLCLKNYNFKIINKESRILLIYDGEEQINSREITDKLKKVFGISFFSFAYITKHTELDNLSEIIYRKITEHNINFESFAIYTKRSYKQFKYKSTEINSHIGAYIKQKTNKKVDLTSPDLLVNIEVLTKQILFYFNKEKGAGGLPSGISGKLVSLISGGIDSPVASWRLMKRGCKLIFVHFHSYPYQQKTSQEKVKDIVRKLTEYQINSKLYLVPFGEIQAKIKISVNPKYRIVLYRRMMIRIAEKIANLEKALGLVTGESIGQVSSQTLHNLNTINSVAKLPVLRPLIGMDKLEIINEAKKIGTFEISIIKDQDCCQLFVPKHPALKTNNYEITQIESPIINELNLMAQQSIKKSEILRFNI